LMAQSDVIVCKPGGLTTAEALEINLPMVLLNPIPGQEEKNLKFLTELGVAFFASNSEDVYHYVKMITTNDKLRQRMKNNAKKISTGSASKIISQIVLEFFKNI
jgi:processive 1,2-diacylglycerol beta-glucosyltransferase